MSREDLSPDYFEYAGNIHIHSTYSDGSGSIEEIVRAGQKAGLDFLIVTDHNHLKALFNGQEGYYDKLLLLVGSEINRECNHYLALGIKAEVAGNDDDPQQVMTQVNQQGGIGFIVHPFEKGSPLFENNKTYPWLDWTVKGYTGISVWNWLSQWRDGLTGIPAALYLALINPHQVAKNGVDQETLTKWDELLSQGLVVGIGCSDAHAIKLGWGPFKVTISDYRLVFRCINTHILLSQPLTGDLETDKSLIYQALKTGSCYFSYDYFHDPRGFRFYGISGTRIVNMGEKAAAEGTSLEVRLNRASLIHLVHNGRRILTAKNRHISFTDLSPGVYRVEIFYRCLTGYRAWIYSNPIFLT